MNVLDNAPVADILASMSRSRTTIADRLRYCIRHAGVSRYRISKDTGIGEAALSRFMTKERGLNLDSADTLAKYFDLELLERSKPAKKGRK